MPQIQNINKPSGHTGRNHCATWEIVEKGYNFF